MLVPLYPAFLLGLLTLAIPIVLHLWRRRVPTPVDFPAVRFLQQAATRRAASIRLERWRLLLLRLLLLSLIVFAFVRPTLRLAAVELAREDRPVSAVLVLDTSFSMATSDNGVVRFDRAVRRAGEIVGQLQPGDELAVLLAEVPPRPLVRRPTPFLESIVPRLRQLSPSFRSSDVAVALDAAMAILEEAKDRRKVIYLLTDLQESAWSSVRPSPNSGERGRTSVYVIDVGRPDASNAAPVEFRTSPAPLAPQQPASLEWQIQTWNLPERQWQTVSYRIGQGAQRKQRVALEPAARTVVSATHNFREPGFHAVDFVLEPDSLAVDNRYFAVVEVRTPPRVVIVDNGMGRRDDTAYFLAQACGSLEELAQGGCTVVRSPTAQHVRRVPLLGAALVIVTGDVNLSPEMASWLSAYVDSGGSLWFVPGMEIDAERYNRLVCERFFRTRIGRRVERALGQEARVQQVDVQHRLLRPFFQEPKTDFSVLRFARYWQLEPIDQGDAVLMRTGDGEPLLVQRRVGQSSFFLLAGGLAPTESNLAYSTLLVPLLAEMIRYCDQHQAIQTQYRIGEPVRLRVELEQPDSVEFLQVVTPSGNVDQLDAPLREGRAVFLADYFRTDEPGVYQVRLPGAGQVFPQQFAVNLDPGESNLTTITLDEARKRLADFRVSTVHNEPTAIHRIARSERGLRLDWLLALAAMAVCLGEMLFANHAVDRV